MRILLALLVFLPLSALADVVSVDFVRILNGNTEEAVYYYENNWKQYRIAAVEKGIISSYRLLVKMGEEEQTDIILITAYATQEQYENREENFAPLMRAIRKDGPALLNDKLPGEFRELVDTGLYASD